MPRILSKGEHKYLRGDEEMEKGSARERTVRNRIRDHVKEAIKEFRTVQDGLNQKDRSLIYNEIEASTSTEYRHKKHVDDETTLEDGLVGIVSFVYEACQNSDLEFETVLDRAIDERHDGDVHVELEVSELDGVDLEEAARKYFLDNETTSEKEIRAMAKSLANDRGKD